MGKLPPHGGPAHPAGLGNPQGKPQSPILESKIPFMLASPPRCAPALGVASLCLGTSAPPPRYCPPSQAPLILLCSMTPLWPSQALRISPHRVPSRSWWELLTRPHEGILRMHLTCHMWLRASQGRTQACPRTVLKEQSGYR